MLLPPLSAPEEESWDLLFDLHSSHPRGWAVVGARMVQIHAAHHRITRPLATGDTDVLVDIRSVKVQELAEWFSTRGFELEGISPEGIGHRFVRDGVVIDLLSIDHSGRAAQRVTIPPARTIEVPGGRAAAARTGEVVLHIGDETGKIIMPDWIGAILLKARAITTNTSEGGSTFRTWRFCWGSPSIYPDFAMSCLRKTVSTYATRRTT